MNMRNRIFSNPVRLAQARVLAVLGCAMLPVLAMADTAPITGDTYITPGNATVNGALPIMNIGAAGGTSQGLVMFNLGGVPANTPITFARLRFYVSTLTTSGSISLYTANAAWSEDTVS